VPICPHLRGSCPSQRTWTYIGYVSSLPLLFESR
jgi:hypothetical protein